MSNYLHNLSARTLKLAPIVQPRVASLFEPMSPISGAAVISSFETQPTSDNLSSLESLQSMPSVQTIAAQRNIDYNESTSDQRFHGGDKQISSHDEPDSAPSAVTFIHSPTIATRREDTFEGSQMLSDGERADLIRLRTQANERLEGKSSTSQSLANFDQRTNTSRIEPRIRKADVEQLDQSRTSMSAGRDRIQATIAHSTIAPRSVVAGVQSNTMPATQTRAEFPGLAVSKEEPRTIRVTIGRVDVRAVFSPPPAPRVRRTNVPTAMSLDDYLKQRNEGHR